MKAYLIIRYEEHPNERHHMHAIELEPNGDILALDDALGNWVQLSMDAAGELQLVVRVPESALPPPIDPKLQWLPDG